MKHIPFFQTRLSEIHIDPSLYDKDNILKTVYENYNKSPCRNTWDNTSNLHHHYEDWENSNFSQVNLIKIKEVYGPIFQKFINSIPFKQNVSFDCYWNITNITAYNQEQHMRIHDHLLDNCIYSAVHYISVSNNSASITFTNPLLALQYEHPIIKKYSQFLNSQDDQNSTYFSTWDIEPKEDYMIIFPSYLKHEVKQKRKQNEDSKLRIAIVTNIDLV